MWPNTLQACKFLIAALVLASPLISSCDICKELCFVFVLTTVHSLVGGGRTASWISYEAYKAANQFTCMPYVFFLFPATIRRERIAKKVPISISSEEAKQWRWKKSEQNVGLPRLNSFHSKNGERPVLNHQLSWHTGTANPASEAKWVVIGSHCGCGLVCVVLHLCHPSDAASNHQEVWSAFLYRLTRVVFVHACFLLPVFVKDSILWCSLRIFSNASFFKSLPVSHLGHEHSLPFGV